MRLRGWGRDWGRGVVDWDGRGAGVDVHDDSGGSIIEFRGGRSGEKDKGLLDGAVGVGVSMHASLGRLGKPSSSTSAFSCRPTLTASFGFFAFSSSESS